MIGNSAQCSQVAPQNLIRLRRTSSAAVTSTSWDSLHLRRPLVKVRMSRNLSWRRCQPLMWDQLFLQAAKLTVKQIASQEKTSRQLTARSTIKIIPARKSKFRLIKKSKTAPKAHTVLLLARQPRPKRPTAVESTSSRASE